MEERITETLLNWVNIKEQTPEHNHRPYDTRYREKIVYLIKGEESLGSISYDEWSKKMDCLYATELKKWPVKDYYESDGQKAIITDLIFHVLMEKAPKDRLANDARLHLYDIAWQLLGKIIGILYKFPSKYILLSIKDDRRILYGKAHKLNKDEEREFSEMYSEESNIEILSAVYSIKEFAKAVSAAHKDDFEPLGSLCAITIDNLTGYWRFAVEDSIRVNKGSQQRDALDVRHTFSRQTREYATSLYDSKKGKSMRQTAKQIHPLVSDFSEGLQGSWSLSRDERGFVTLYRWLQQRNKK